MPQMRHAAKHASADRAPQSGNASGFGKHQRAQLDEKIPNVAGMVICAPELDAQSPAAEQQWVCV